MQASVDFSTPSLEIMPLLATVFACILVAHLLFNVVVTHKLVRSSAYEPAQKGVQIALLWLIPVFGVIVVLLFLQPSERPAKYIEHDLGDDDIPESVFTDHSSSAGASGASEGD